ncbi:MAG TPA: minichromosome maintenance protein MCM [Candidatus Nanoarchaeia archaeon]|nr:minichromosome maintenance protein MCM [Candidatus Nanoarchaeia archaeon]
MDANEQITKFKELIESAYLGQLNENIRKEKNYVVVDFADLSKFDPELADLLLDQPEEVIRAAELGIVQLDLPEKQIKVRFANLPDSQKLLIRNIRSKHLGKMYLFEGVVRQKSDVRPQVTSAKFECPSCGNVINVLQVDQKMREPSRCGCGRKGKFKMLSKELIDAQRLVLEEVPEDLESGAQPKRMSVLLKEDLVSPLTERYTNPGSRVSVIGFVKELPLIARDGGKLTRFDLMIEANYVVGVQEDFYDIEISKEEEERIKEIAESPDVYSSIINSIAPSIYGHDRIKEAIGYQLVSGVKKTRADGVKTRGDIHILLLGDPGAGKSQLLKRVAKIAPKARFVSGKGVSGAGLTAAVVRDEFLQGWSLEAGALPLSNNGFCMIDEMDKMSQEDTAAMHEALEGQTITISKANIQATLRCETTVLAAANPKFGRFDPYDIIAKQINLPPALINRFDLIFPIKDLPDREKDSLLADHILKLHQKPETENPEIDTDTLKKFISYARQKANPKLSSEALEEIKKYYVEMRNKESDEGASKAVPISPRQLEALVRLSEASAKIRLALEVTKEDAKRAIDIVHYCLTQIGIDPETGKIDIDRIATGISSSERSHIMTVKEVISELESKIGKTIPIDDIVSECKAKGISEDKVEESLEKLKRTGDIFEPRRGFVQKI